MRVTRKDCKLSRKCKLIGLKYFCPQIHYIRIFKLYLFQLNEIDNDGISSPREHTRKIEKF